MACGKICPAGQLRQRLLTSQVTIFSRCAAVKLRGMTWTRTPRTDTASPAIPASSPASSARRRTRPPLRRGLRDLCPGAACTR